MKHKEEFITEEKVINTPAGGVLIGKDKDGQTIIPNDGSLGGFLVGRLHKDGGIKAINKGTGQPLEMQSNEVVITAPAVADTTKREFEGKMMTNREILSKINSDGGGVSFADGGDIPAKIHTTDCEYKFGGKVVKDTDIAHSLGMNSTLKKGKQHFSSGDTTYDVDGIYNAIKKGKLRLKTKEVETFPMKYSVYDKNYAENHKIDFRKPNGITVRTESGEEVLIDGNHRMNNAYLKGKKTMKTYYVEDPKQIAKFTKKNKFELGGENKMGGHLSSGKSLKQIAEIHNVSLAHINEQLAKGLEVEKEHFADFKDRTRVAKDHLVENPNYYTILDKAGLKMGGHIQRQELVEKSKKGDTPARDLNNYNDVMDLEADGAVGGDSGLTFANGGSLDDYNFNFTVGKWGGFDIGDGEYFMEDFKSLVKSKPQFFVKTEEFKDYFETTYIPNPFDVEDLEGATDKEYIEMFEFANTYLTSKLDIVNELKNNNKIGIYNIVPSKKTSKIEIGDMAWYDLGLNGLGSVISHTPTKESPKYEELQQLYKENFIYENGGITHYNSNLEGDSVNIVENGFSNGGGVGLPKVAYVKVSNTGASLSSLIGNIYNSYIEFAESVENAYKQLGKTVRSFVELEAFDENDEKLLSASSYISNQKNTVKNFNPFTGNYKNLEKSLQNSRPRSFQKFDWEDWLLSKVNPSTNVSQTLNLLNNQSSAEPKIVDAVNVEFVYPDGRIEVSTTINISNLKNALANFWNIVDKKSWQVRITPFENQFNSFEENNLIIGNDFAEYNPETFSEEQLGNKLKKLYPDLDWSIFLREKTTTYEKQKVNFLTATTDGATKKVINVFEVKNFIEQNYTSNGGSDGKLELYLNGDMTGSWKMSYGDGKTCSTCYDLFDGGTKRIKEILLSYAGADEFDWSDFFEQEQTPTSNDVVPKTVEISISDFDEAVKKLEKASSKVATEYNKEIYDKSLKFLYDTKATYELALKFTPESAFMYERLDIMKKLADLEKNIKKIEDMKKGGTFYMLAKILEKLQRGENWKVSEDAKDVITNKLPQSEIDVIIRSNKFKNWFGNWEKALINDEYDNVSKALTDGIPSVYHHGARRIKYTYREVSNGVLYLAENISYAIWFSKNSTAQSEEGNYLTECFVNIKNPIDLTAFHVNQIDLADLVKYIDAIYPLAKIYDFIPAQVALLIKTNQPTNIKMWAWQLIRKYAKFVNHIKENTPYDGFLYYENNPSDQVLNPITGELEENVTKAVAIFKSHQVKVVDAVLFDGGLDDWRFENGGKINN